MITRFTKLFLFVVLVLVRLYIIAIYFHATNPLNHRQKTLLASVTLLQPVPSHFNFRPGALFGGGDIEKEYHALPIEVHDRPLAIPNAKGSVIMSKLGNETAKCVHFCVPRPQTC
jgi:hypothetical protein